MNFPQGMFKQYLDQKASFPTQKPLLVPHSSHPSSFPNTVVFPFGVRDKVWEL
jgi:hypothetical protein